MTIISVTFYYVTEKLKNATKSKLTSQDFQFSASPNQNF